MSVLPSVLLGYHGCSRAIADRVLAGEAFEPSREDHDWLGPGTYFWENDPRRALEWAVEKETRGKCDHPTVVGAVIMPGRCLDLTTRDDLDLLAEAYIAFRAAQEAAKLEMPRNQDLRLDTHRDRKLRYLDCAVIRHLEAAAENADANLAVPGLAPIDTVRGLFTEGGELYGGAGFSRKTHSQIAVVRPMAIVGVFLPRPYPRL